MKSARSKFSTLQQICAYIPGHLVAKLARKYGVDEQARTFSPWSHIVALLYAQLSHAIGLNNVCDGMRMHLSKLLAIRGATPPARNTLLYANKVRSAQMAEDLFWSVLEHLMATMPLFGGKMYRGFPRRFKRMIHVVNSSTIQLIANCMDWVKHRRKKAAAKLHMRLNLQSFLPKFAIVDTAGHNDNKRARELYADIGAGEIVLFDKAYVDFEHLYDLDARGVSWVTRAKDTCNIAMSSVASGAPEAVSYAMTKSYCVRPLRENTIPSACAWCAPSSSATEKTSRWHSSPTTSSVRRKRSRTCTNIVGLSKPSSSRSSRRCSCATSSATARMRFRGKSGWHCWSMCCFVSWRASARSRTVSPGCSAWCAHACGRAAIYLSPCKTMGQQVATFGCLPHPSKPICLDLHRDTLVCPAVYGTAGGGFTRIASRSGQNSPSTVSDCQANDR